MLVSVVLPEAGIRPAETSSASVGGVVQSPVSAPTRDGNLQNILAELEALKADKEKHSAELEALKADKEKHYAELEALKAENKELQGQVIIRIHRFGMMKDSIPVICPAKTRRYVKPSHLCRRVSSSTCPRRTGNLL